MTGAVTFDSDRPPQNFIHCGVCGYHFMMCDCPGVQQGIDYIFVGLPDPPSTRAELLERFTSIVAVNPSMRAFNAKSWCKNESGSVVTSLEARQDLLMQMMEDYILIIPDDKERLPSLAAAVGGFPLREKSASDHVEAVAKECRAAMTTFIAGDWSTVTKIGAWLIQNAFQTSDPTKYPLHDRHLAAVFEKGVACLLGIHGQGFSETGGWRLALECDRPPQLGSDQPRLVSATERDAFIQFMNANPNWQPKNSLCAYCGKENADKLCSRCKVKYCGRECQVAHWKAGHKKSCKPV
mmetsp:Transcript_20970/g.31799  ORF Transcript_20970/g.31799 Transcript_20970/m.31799 type:complete len:295 (-) Transcript_20970:274-1158(-)